MARAIPCNPDGHRTAYLWERVWEQESWLEILGRYVIAQRDSKKQIQKLIFPASTSSTPPAGWWPPSGSRVPAGNT